MYDAITIDAQVFYSSGRNLRKGLIGELSKQTREDIKVVMSEVVKREIEKALSEQGQAVIDSITKTIRNSRNNNQLDAVALKKLDEVKANLLSAKDYAHAEMESFVKTSGCTVLSTDNINLEELLNAYFERKPPFSNAGKKSEFPDAISLQLLQRLADSKNIKILAVSNDKDWKVFCDDSKNIDLVSNLGDALKLIQKDTNKASKKAVLFISELLNTYSGIHRNLLDLLDLAISEVITDIEFDSPLPGVSDDVYVNFKSVEFFSDNPETYPIDLIRHSEDEIVIKFPVIVEVHVEANVNFHIYDSIDKDYVSMGGNTIHSDHKEEMQILVTFTNNSDPESHIELLNVQLVSSLLYIDVGYIENPFEEDYYDRDII